MNNVFTFIFVLIISSGYLTLHFDNNDSSIFIMKVICGLAIIISIIGLFKNRKQSK